MYKKRILIILLIFFSCWSGPQTPAINSSYNFSNVGKIEIHEILDYITAPGSGHIVLSSLAYNFLKYGYTINEGDNNKTLVLIDKGSQTLEIFCTITQFIDSEIIIIPYRDEDRGYTKTIIEKSINPEKDNKNSKSSQIHTSSTITHSGKLKVGNRIEYTQNKVGVMLKLVDKDTGNLVWSNSYWYSGLEMQHTIDSCIKNFVLHIKNIFNHTI